MDHQYRRIGKNDLHDKYSTYTCEMALDFIEYITIDECVPRSTEPRTIHIYYKFLDKPLKNKNNALK